MAAEFHDQPFHGRGALAGDELADFGRTGEAHGADARIGIHAADDGGGIAGHDIEDAGGQAGALAKLGKGQRRERRFAGGMGDDGAAGGKGRRHLAGDHRGGEIPRRDDTDDPERLAAHDHFRARQMAGDALGIETLPLFGIPFDEAGGVIDLATGFAKRLALLQRHQQGEVLARLQHQAMPFAQDRRALLRQHVPPGGEGGGGGGNRLCRLLAVERGDPGKRCGGGGVRHFETAAVAPGDPAAADIGEIALEMRIGQTRKRIVKPCTGEYGGHGGLLLGVEGMCQSMRGRLSIAGADCRESDQRCGRS